jgi:hypothetical protein
LLRKIITDLTNQMIGSTHFLATYEIHRISFIALELDNTISTNDFQSCKSSYTSPSIPHPVSRLNHASLDELHRNHREASERVRADPSGEMRCQRRVIRRKLDRDVIPTK